MNIECCRRAAGWKIGAMVWRAFQTACCRFRRICARVLAALLHVHIILASIIGATSKYGGHQHAAYNELLPALVNEFTGRGRSTEFADMSGSAGFGTSCDVGHDQLCCPFHVHFNDKGYAAMARVWQRLLVRWAERGVGDTAVQDSIVI